MLAIMARLCCKVKLDINAEVKKPKVLKNVIILSFGFLLVFLPYQCIANLQSTLNSHENNVGLKSQTTIYVCVIISASLLPPLCISRLTHKWTIVLGIICYIPYIAAHFMPTTSTLIPTAVLLGFAASLLWSAKCDYLTLLVNNPSSLIKYFGFFFTVFQMSQVVGNAIASFIFEDNSSNLSNFTNICGANFCPIHQEGDISVSSQNTQRLHTLVWLFVSSCLASALLISLFLDPLIKEKIPSECTVQTIQMPQSSKILESETSPHLLLCATLRHAVTNKVQLLLIPITLYSGAEQGFLMTEFNRAYIACKFNSIHSITMIFIAYGVTDAISSFATAFFLTTHICLFIGTLMNIAMHLILLTWKSDSQRAWKDPVVFYVIACSWGFTDAIWQTRINGKWNLHKST